MKIAILSWTYLPYMGGTEIATQNLARALAKRKHDVLVVTTRDADLPEESVEDGFCVHRTKSLRNKSLKYILFCFSTLKLLRRFNPDIIHAQAIWMGLPALMSRKLLNIPYLVWGRGADIYFPRLFKGLVSKLVLRNAAAVIALTENLKERMQGVYSRDVLVIGNGVDIENFGTCSKEEARRHLNVVKKEKVAIFVGTLTSIKGIEYLIEAMGIIRRRNHEVRLLIVGDGVDRKKLEALVRKLNLERNVTFVGRIENAKIPEYLAASDVFVLPSLSEGFPNVILEAMAAGLPIVTTNITGLPEIVKDGGNGFLVEPGSSNQLAEKISLILSDKKLRQRISANNKRKAEQYSWEVVAEKLDKVYFNATTVHL